MLRSCYDVPLWVAQDRGFYPLFGNNRYLCCCSVGKCSNGGVCRGGSSLYDSHYQAMKRIINTSNAPAAVGPYSQAVEVNGIIFVSGQIPVNPATGRVVEGGIQEQAKQVLENLGAILREVGLDYSNVVKTTCLLSDMDNFGAMNEVYSRYFTADMPARAAYGVVRLPLGVLVEIEAVAAR